MSDDISFQTWICPKCYDDHSMRAECKPLGVDKFSPSLDDNSFIAQEFRKLEAELRDARQLIEADNAALKKLEAKCKFQAEMLERAEQFLAIKSEVTKDSPYQWLLDLERGQKEGGE
jgi:hypothetical protein